MPTPLTAPFWSAAARGELVIQHCAPCDRFEWTPQAACSSCLSQELEWKPVSGRGTLYSYSEVSRPQTPTFNAPYVVAIVQLEEGPRMLTDLVGVEVPKLQIGQHVRLEIERIDENIGLFHFRAV